MEVDYRLYLCTDRNLLPPGRRLEQVVEEAVQGGVTVVQVREKTASALEFYQIALAIKKITDYYQVPLIINDRVDIALAVKAAGVHIGQGDLPLRAVKRILPTSMLIGVSVSTVAEAQAAQADKADYVGVSPVFLTGTKPDALQSVGLKGLEDICSAISIPVVAIGGINQTNAAAVYQAGATGLAVISAIISADEPGQAAGSLLEALRISGT